MTTAVLPRRSAGGRRRRVVLAGATLAVLGGIGLLVAQFGDSGPSGPMDGRPFGVPLWLPDGYELDPVAEPVLASYGPLLGMEQQADSVLSAQLLYDGPDGVLLSVDSADAIANGLTAAATGADVRLADGTVAQWDRSMGVLAWTLPTGQAVALMGAPNGLDDLAKVAANMWYVDERTWQAISADADAESAEIQRWRIPGDGSSVDLVVSGGLRSGLRLTTDHIEWQPQNIGPECSGVGTSSAGATVVYAATTTATAFRVTGPDGEAVTAQAATAPGMPMIRWAAVTFPNADPRWVEGNDHGAGCTVIRP